jgi:hypothetical protein
VERIGSDRTTSLIGGTEHEIDAKDHASALDQVFRHLPELFASGRDAWGTAEIRPGDVV